MALPVKVRVVADLKKDEFEVLEDGVQQDIISFTLVHGGAPYSTSPAATAAAAGRDRSLRRRRGRSTTPRGRILLFFVDDLHLDFRTLAASASCSRRSGTTLPARWRHVAAWCRPAPRRLPIDMNYDKKRFDEAIKKIATRSSRRTHRSPAGRPGTERVALSRARRLLDGLRHGAEPRRCRTAARSSSM